jgi:hypothetical protein
MTGKVPFHEVSNDMAVMLKVMGGQRPSRPFSWSGAAALDYLWHLLQDCWNETPDMRPKVVEIVQRLTSPPIQARTAQATADWDEESTSKFRRSLQSPPPLPSITQIEQMIFGDGCYGSCAECGG